jgi:hypothetical protein
MLDKQQSPHSSLLEGPPQTRRHTMSMCAEQEAAQEQVAVLTSAGS